MKLFGMLGSEHAGERDNAVDAIGRALAASGLSWRWICELIAGGTTEQDAAARDRLLSRLVEDRVKEAMIGAWSLSVEEHADLRKVNTELREARSLRSVGAHDVHRALEVADMVRQRYGPALVGRS